MRNVVVRFCAVVLTVILLPAMIFGCNDVTRDNTDDAQGSAGDPSEYIFIAQSVPFPREFVYVSNLVCLNNDDKVFFSASMYEDIQGNPYVSAYTAKLYTMSVDGSGLTELAGYTPSAIMSNGIGVNFTIDAMASDNDKNIWVAESWNYYDYALPADFDEQTDDPWKYFVSYESGAAIRKLDATGAELSIMDISDIMGQHENLSVRDIAIDENGNAYISTYRAETADAYIYVFDSFGNIIFNHNESGMEHFSQLVRLPDNSIAFSTNRNGTLEAINLAENETGEPIVLPAIETGFGGGKQVYTAAGDYDVMVADAEAVYGFSINSQEPALLLNWNESYVINGGIEDIIMLSDDLIIAINPGSQYTYVTLARLLRSELPERTTITLASFWPEEIITNAVTHFNSINPYYCVEIVDYVGTNVTDEDYWAGIERLSTEIVTGSAPDIIDFTRLSYRDFVAGGYLVDIYPYIDADPGFSRSSFVEAALRSAEADGGLYCAFAGFYVYTIIGNPDILGAAQGWDVFEFREVLRMHPDADMPLGAYITRLDFLKNSIMYSIGDYVDWSVGTVNFNNDGFIQLLEFVCELQIEFNWDAAFNNTIVTMDEAIPAGRQIMYPSIIQEFGSISYLKSVFGGEIVYKGYPAAGRNGNAIYLQNPLAITEASLNKDGAWAFLSTILDKDWQINNVYQFPTNTAAFDYSISVELEMERRNMVTQADIDQVLALIESASHNRASGATYYAMPDEGLWDIIAECATDYFNGVSSAQDTARIIQSRASIYVSERS